MDNDLDRKRSKSVMNLKNLSRIQGQFSEPAQLSSAILRHSNIQLTFSKAERFPKLIQKDGAPTYITLKDTMTKRSTSFGFGNKQLTTLENDKKDRLNPAPGAYEIQKERTKAFSFGIKLHNITANDINPGPGQYNLDKSRSSPKFSMYPKINADIKQEQSNPNFGTYNPRDTITQNQRFRKISFGIGKRPSPGQIKFVPGPGAYDLKSIFELKFKQKQ